LQPNDILFVNKGTPGRVCLVPDPVNFCAAQDMIGFRCDENKINYKYLFAVLRSNEIQKNVENNHVGLVIPHFRKQDLPSLMIPIRSPEEQEAIGNLYITLSEKIELNQRINAELESMAKTLYDYWFVQFDFPNEKGKPYKSAGGKMVWNEALKREIPLGWEVGTLLDIADYMNGLPCQKFRPTGNESLRVIKIREMHEGFSENSELTRPDIPQKSIIENGDVLFSWSASLEVQIWTGGKGALNQHIFKVTSDKYPKSFYYYQLINYLTHFKMMAENRKTTMGHITQEHLQQSRIALPPKELTLKLEKIISPIFEKKMVNEIESQTLTGLRDRLLPMLMNGQVKVG
jgi:type I restriction enzyme S subunit